MCFDSEERSKRSLPKNTPFLIILLCFGRIRSAFERAFWNGVRGQNLSRLINVKLPWICKCCLCSSVVEQRPPIQLCLSHLDIGEGLGFEPPLRFSLFFFLNFLILLDYAADSGYLQNFSWSWILYVRHKALQAFKVRPLLSLGQGLFTDGHRDIQKDIYLK